MRNRPSLHAETTSPHVEVTPAQLKDREKYLRTHRQNPPATLGQAPTLPLIAPTNSGLLVSQKLKRDGSIIISSYFYSAKSPKQVAREGKEVPVINLDRSD